MKRPCHLQAITNTSSFACSHPRLVEEEEGWPRHSYWGYLALYCYFYHVDNPHWWKIEGADDKLKFDFEELSQDPNFEVRNSLALIARPFIDEGDEDEYLPGFVLIQPDEETETYFFCFETGEFLFITRVPDPDPDRLAASISLLGLGGQHKPSEVELENLPCLLTLEKTFAKKAHKPILIFLKHYILTEGARKILR